MESERNTSDKETATIQKWIRSETIKAIDTTPMVSLEDGEMLGRVSRGMQSQDVFNKYVLDALR